jgi:hypothetical protein
MDITDLEAGVAVWISMAVISLVILGIAILLVFGLIRAGMLSPSVALVIALSILALVSILGFMLVRDAELITVAGTAVGAIAGAVTAVWSAEKKDEGPQDVYIPPKKLLASPKPQEAPQEVAEVSQESVVQETAVLVADIPADYVPANSLPVDSTVIIEEVPVPDDIEPFNAADDVVDDPDEQTPASGAPDHPDELDDEEDPDLTWDDEPTSEEDPTVVAIKKDKK